MVELIQSAIEIVGLFSLSLVLAMIGYLFIGVGWSISKWWIYIRDIAARNWAERYEWVSRRKARLDISDDDYPVYESACANPPRLWQDKVQADWQRYVKVEYSGKPIKKPMVSNNKGRISVWILYWPCNVLWTLAHNLIQRFVHLRGLLQGMSDRAFQGIDE